MTWIRVDDNIAHHPKFLAAGPVAGWLWLCGQGYCNKYLTDGFISDAALELFPIRRPAEAAQTLVSVGLWERVQGESSASSGRVQGGFRVRSYLEYQPSKEQVLERRKRDLLRKQGKSVNHSARNPDGFHYGIRKDSEGSHPIPSQVPQKDSTGADAPADRLTPDRLCLLWNDYAEIGNLPKAVALNATRQRHAKARIAEYTDPDWWLGYFDRIVASDFLCGRVEHTGKHQHWRPTFDWILAPANMTKILEGAYDNAPAKVPKQGKHWYDDCPHEPKCERLTDCRLKTEKGTR